MELSTMTAEILAVTEHLVLRRMTNHDAATLAAYRSDPVQARYQSWEAPYPVDSARALITEMRDMRFAQPGAWLQIGIETDRRLIGDVAVRVDGDEPRQATVGFTLAADAQGRGFATEALRTVISLLFTEHGVHRISADCDARNDRSVALLERIGMRREAHHRKSAWCKGEWTDEYVYAILAEEWRDENDGDNRPPPGETGRGDH
jgi:aminoglycoside 6'-N-acetyltransferase